MNIHKLLQKQVDKYLTLEQKDNASIKAFLEAINNSYSSFERDSDIQNHAFNISEQEYEKLYADLNTEHELKKISIERLKEAVKEIDQNNEIIFNKSDDELLVIVNYLNNQIIKRRESENDLTRTVELLVTLLSNLNSAIIVEDEHRKILFTNQLFCDTFSIPLSPNEMKGLDCSNSINEIKALFENSENFEVEINEILKNKTPVFGDELKFKDGRILERDYVPIYINNEYKGHLWDYTDVTNQKKAQASLLLSEDRYRNIVEKSTDIIYRANREGLFTFVNEVTERITGYNKEELYQKHFTHIVKREFRKDVFEFYYRQVKLKKQNSYLEFPIITKNGEEKWIGQSVQLLNIDSYDFEVTAISIDISDRKKYENRLIETNQRLELHRTLINNTSDAIQVADEKGQLVYINDEASKRLGIDKLEVSNYNVKDFETVFKNEGEWEKHLLELKQNDKIILEGKNYNSVTKTYFPVEVTVRYVQIDTMGYVIANSRDITERKLTENTIIKQKEKYQNIIANMNMGLLEVDLEDTIQYLNPSFLTISGYTSDELIGKKASQLFLRDPNQNTTFEKTKLRENGVSDMYEVPVKNKKGELKWWMISGAPNYDNEGNIIGSVGIHLDITEKKQLELEYQLAKSKAEESSLAKAAFLANMSHEIRTPLNAIIGMIRELSKDNLSDKQSQYLNNTSIASQHLLSVLNNVLDMSKIEAGELQLDYQHFNFADTLNDIKSIMMSRASEKGLYLKVNHPIQSNFLFVGDSSRLRQIFLNLIGNAIKFTQQGGVTISYDITDTKNGFNEINIKIVDTGIGMNESYVKNIFNKFSQEDSSTSRKYGGSGLGLAITRELIQLMKGSIAISTKKNIGTTIEMKFPLSIGNIEMLEKNDDFESSNRLEHAEILLVEDNEFNRLVASNTLNYYNCKITEVSNGSEAIDLLKTGKQFDIILMDLQMPVLDGFEATVIIRNDLKITTPIIALTANAFKSELEHCIKIGMNDYVTKPFEEDQLISIITKYISHTSADKNENTININPEVSLTKQYDLDKLFGITRNDKVYANKMITIFIEQSLLAIKEINEAYLNKEFEVIAKIAHKIKPSIDSMGIEVLRTNIREIEENVRKNTDGETLKEQINFLSNTLQNVVDQLKLEVI